MTGRNQRLDPTLTANFRNRMSRGYPHHPLPMHGEARWQVAHVGHQAP